jgi:hypothetical protein
MPDVLQIRMEPVEPRTRYERQAAVIDGYLWDLYASENVGIDPVTLTAFLLPLPLTPEWQTTTTGVYARMGSAQYALTTPSKWTQFDRSGLVGNTYLQSLDVNEVVYTGSAVPQNCPIYLSWYAYNAGNSRFVQMWCGWGTADGRVSVKVWSDNSVEVYRNDVYVATGSLSDIMAYPSTYGTRRGADAGRAKQNAQETVDLFLIPTRGNEILIYSSTTGGGFNVQLTDVDPFVANITPSDKFWWYVQQGKATVQLQAPMGSRGNGVVYSLPYYLRYPPLEDTPFGITSYYNLSGFGSASFVPSVVDADTLAPFVPDGTAVATRLKVAMSGDGYASPFIYGASYAFQGSAENTAGGEHDITSFWAADTPARLDVGEDPSQVTFSFGLKNPATLAGSVGAIQTQGNRPFDARLGTVEFISGRTDAPKEQMNLWNDEASRLMFECRDRWKAFETFLIADPEPLDGVNIGTAFAYFVGLPGYSESDVDIEYMDFFFDVVTGASKGEWAVIPQVGDTAAQWIQRLYEDFARHMYIGWRPLASGPKFCVWGTATLGTAPSVTLYPSVEEAGGTLTNVYRSFCPDTLEPEANDIYAIGQDKRTGLPIVAHYTDDGGIDPTTPIEDRPPNWLGERRKYSLQAPEITSQESAVWCVGVLASRLAVERSMAEWRSDFLLKSDGAPVWRGDVVKLVGLGRYRVQTLSAEFKAEWGTASPYRECVYVGERIGD